MPGSILRLVAICALASAGCMAAPTHTVTGLVDLLDSTGAGIAVTGTTCNGVGTYLEYGPGTRVTVGGANGAVTGTLSAGEARSSTDCRFTFAVPGVPDSPSYEVQVGPGGGPPLPGAELAADNWVYALTIGSASSPEPPSPDLPEATYPGVGAGLTCGGPTFPASGLDAPLGAEKASGPEYDALRATLAAFAGAFPGAASWSWRLVGQDATDAIFLATTGAATDTGLISVDVRDSPTGWQVGNIGDCNLRRVLSDGYGPASWALNPAYPAPTAATTTLEILVWEIACSSGVPATGRMSAPVIDYGTSNVTITLGVRPLQGLQTCPMGPGAPASVRLSEPLGNRTLLDGGTVPPAAPSAPGG